MEKLRATTKPDAALLPRLQHNLFFWQALMALFTLAMAVYFVKHEQIELATLERQIESGQVTRTQVSLASLLYRICGLLSLIVIAVPVLLTAFRIAALVSFLKHGWAYQPIQKSCHGRRPCSTKSRPSHWTGGNWQASLSLPYTGARGQRHDGKTHRNKK